MAGPVRADVVTDWNDYAQQAIATAGAAARCRPDAPLPAAPRPNPVVFLDFAMVQVAVHDAVQAIEGRYEPYGTPIWGASGSTVAAVAKSAHDLLVHLLPLQAVCLDARYSEYLAARGIPADDPGVEAGRQAAAGIIALRTGDGRFPSPAPPPFLGGTDPGEWRPTPPAFAPMAVPWLGDVRRFTVDDDLRERLASKAPPALTSRRYTRDFEEVKALGSLNSTARTQEQTYLAYFYADNPGMIWNRGLRAIATARGLDASDAARLFALANMAAADAIMTSWDNKNRYVQWRPVTAIREADHDGNPDTVADPAWTALIATPPYPDWSSGANNTAAAYARTAALFFATNRMDFTLTSTTSPALLPPPHNVRTYTHFTRMADDMVEARMLLGIHFRASDDIGRAQGKRIATRAFACFLRPVGDAGDCDGGDQD
jgi:hypothetical protein